MVGFFQARLRAALTWVKNNILLTPKAFEGEFKARIVIETRKTSAGFACFAAAPVS
jgi:hypothetical protein